MNKTQFNLGDKVYCPIIGTGTFILKSSILSKFPLKIRIKDIEHSFTKEGYLYDDHKLPSIFKVNEENQELLSKLYGIEFEKPLNFLDYHLSLGSKVLCLVVKNPKELPKKIWKVNNNNEYIDVIASKKGETYYADHGVLIRWEHLLPISIDEKGNIKYLSF